MMSVLKLWIVTVMIISVLNGCVGLNKPSPDVRAAEKNAAGRIFEQPVWDTNSLEPNHLALAEQLVADGFYDVALIQLKQAMAGQKKNPQVFNLSGVCAMETNDFKAAETFFTQALALDPDNAPAYNNLGIMYAMLDRTEKAESAFNRAVALDPGRADFLNNLGYLKMAKKSFHDAEIQFRKALKLNPEVEAAANNLAICLGMQKKDVQALDLLYKHHDADTALHNMACIYMQRNEPEKARKMLKAIKKKPHASSRSPFDTQILKPGQPVPENVPTGMPGDVANMIYTQKYWRDMKSDDPMDKGGK